MAKTARVSLTDEDLRDLSRGLQKLIENEMKIMERGYDKSSNPDVRAFHEAAAHAQHKLMEIDRKLIKAASRIGAII